ncbi:Tetratricopeptide repeat-containing protein [Cnuella takakiae]|uniref:Tetratricopeptide repeat-containing protein n=1 Tax=Cnuella takakiae TaxID=1302690 RepID=A0A1M5IWD9_9BACT|nr:tetratricopeptide repeat protein [Cnuella takakiae]OLY91440.1 hypothetical protein BUE76_05630 [Cnuella takakiae]SHG32455.1 Tetratricopeptide repeat-containing protein [Cnuella takakiae]
MRKKYFVLIAVLAVLLPALYFGGRNKKGFSTKLAQHYVLQERKGIAATWPEWNDTKQSAERLVRMVRENPDDQKSMLALASLYIQEGRASGNHDYYDGAALYHLEQVLEKNPANFEALTMKALIQLSKHHFAAALETSTKAQKLNPHNAFLYGLMTDSYVELGQYDKAVASADQMVAIRPDMRSYARVAYLREIHGDMEGAITAMALAVDASGYGDEPSSWTRIQLGELLQKNGDYKQAGVQYQVTLKYRPDYAYAVAGLGRIAQAEGNLQQALAYFLKADSLPADHGFGEEIAQTYLAMGQREKALHVLKEMETELKAEEQQNAGVANAPYHTDMELAAVYLLMEQYEQALLHVKKEYDRRPGNIKVNELMAWLHYKNGSVAKALPIVQQALRTGSTDPVLMARSGLILTAAGKTAEGRTLLQKSLAQNALRDASLLRAVHDVLKTNQQS